MEISWFFIPFSPWTNDILEGITNAFLWKWVIVTMDLFLVFKIITIKTIHFYRVFCFYNVLRRRQYSGLSCLSASGQSALRSVNMTKKRIRKETFLSFLLEFRVWRKPLNRCIQTILSNKVYLCQMVVITKPNIHVFIYGTIFSNLLVEIVSF